MKIKLSSGYDGDQSDWREFLAQWKKNLKKYPDIAEDSIINGFGDAFDPVEDDDISDKIESLGLKKLPKSYLDFLKFHNLSQTHGKKLLENYMSLMIPFKDIGYLRDVKRDLYDIYI